MSTTAWVVQAKSAVGRAWRRASLANLFRELGAEMREAKRASGNAGWWSDMQDRWAEEDLRWGERSSENSWSR